MWGFCGVVVVFCVVNVVIKQSWLVVIENVTRIVGLFLRFPFWEWMVVWSTDRGHGCMRERRRGGVRGGLVGAGDGEAEAGMLA